MLRKLNWQPHLHLLAADGAFAFRGPDELRFHPCPFRDPAPMTELYRRVVITRLHRAKVLTDDVATNMMSWKHSGFHVHHSDPFPATDREQLTRRLAYAFRTPVPLSQLSYRDGTVDLRTRNGRSMEFTPPEFLAHLTVHIPNHYQHYRRYAGLYAPATRTFWGLATGPVPAQPSDKTLTPRWATLLARIFGRLPIKCPRCHTDMKRASLETALPTILALVPKASRAPPPKKIEPFRDVHGKTPLLVAAETKPPYGPETFSQLRPLQPALQTRISRKVL